jgi:putrescine:ornithine antiporter
VFAIYTSGKDAVMGGMLVTALTYLLWGFIAPRFSAGKQAAGSRTKAAAAVLAALLGLGLAMPPSASAATIDTIKQKAKIVFGFRTDARPFSFRESTGAASGYTVALCQTIAEQVKAELKLPSLALEWVPVTASDRFTDLQKGSVDLLCGVDYATASQIVWRGSPARTVLEKKTFVAVKDTTAEPWLAGRRKALQIESSGISVATYADGALKVLNREADAFFGDRAILLDAARRSGEALSVLDRQFTYEPVALAFRKGDDDFRLVLDRALSRIYASPEFAELYAKWFDRMDESAGQFFRIMTLPE